MNALIPFEATVRLGSLTRAAEELHVTHGAVSRQLKALEVAVGAELFRRDGRLLVPTDTAVELARHVHDAFERLTMAVRQAQSHTERGPFVLSCEPTLMMKWLLPRLPTFTAACPEIELHLSAAGGPVDLHRAGIDVAIRRTDFPLSKTTTAAHLFKEWVGPVCSPEIAAASRDPLGVLSKPRLVSQTRPDAWRVWATITGCDVPATTEQHFEHFYLSLEAATAGLGVAIGPYALVKNDLESGRLTAPLGFIPDGTSYVLLASHGNTDPRLARLHEWLRLQRADSVPPAATRDLVPKAERPAGRRREG